MACKTSDVACAIEQLTASLNGWDWNSFAETLLATLLTAAATALIAWLVLRSEKGERYRSTMDSSFVRLVEAVTARIADLEAYMVDRALGAGSGGHLPSAATYVRQPSQFPLLGALAASEIVARGEDAVIVQAVRDRLGDTLRMSPQEEMGALSEISIAIGARRSGRWTLDKALERIREGRK